MAYTATPDDVRGLDNKDLNEAPKGIETTWEGLGYEMDPLRPELDLVIAHVYATRSAAAKNGLWEIPIVRKDRDIYDVNCFINNEVGEMTTNMSPWMQFYLHERDHNGDPIRNDDGTPVLAVDTEQAQVIEKCLNTVTSILSEKFFKNKENDEKGCVFLEMDPWDLFIWRERLLKDGFINESENELLISVLIKHGYIPVDYQNSFSVKTIVAKDSTSTSVRIMQARDLITDNFLLRFFVRNGSREEAINALQEGDPQSFIEWSRFVVENNLFTNPKQQFRDVRSILGVLGGMKKYVKDTKSVLFAQMEEGNIKKALRFNRVYKGIGNGTVLVIHSAK